MQIFKMGDGVSGMYSDETSGTVLDSSGVVIAVIKRDDGTSKVTVRFSDDREVDYIVSKTGLCEYMHKTVDFTPHPE